MLKAKDKQGFDLLYRRYSKVLYDIILKIVHHRELAEDVLQDSFVKIWKSMPAYDCSKGSLFTYILNVARNTAIDTTRSAAYKKDAYTFTQGEDIVDRHLYIQQAVDGIGIEKHLHRLKQEHQQVIDFIYFQGYTQEETAQQLHLPLGTTKSRVKSALNRLKLLLI